MKKFISACLCFLLLCPVIAFSAETNVDGGSSGGMGSGSSGNTWTPGNDGVRITLVDSTTGWIVKHSIDLSDANINTHTIIHFGKVSKLYYSRISTSLTGQMGDYEYIKPPISIPTIISSSSGGQSDIVEIKKYFAAEDILKLISHYVGMDYTEMISGKYKLVLEPIAYFKFGGVMFAMTATEAACYDQMLGGQLRSKMVSLTHKNLPLSMFLQTADLGIPAWTGSTAKQNNVTIITSLGIGIIYFDEIPEEEEVTTGDFEYHTDTDVITSVSINSKKQYTPDNNGTLTFTVGGQNYTKDFVCPAGGWQLMWFKWHTPSTPQTLTIQLSGAASGSMTANIIDLSEKEPPDPQFTDRNKHFSLKNEPHKESNLSTTWYEWEAEWKTYPPPASGGHWIFSKKEYSASLDVKYQLIPADRVQTEVNLGFDNWEMKSGYGVEANIAVKVSSRGGVTSSDLTPVQHIEATFPEFRFETYNRLLEPENSAKYNTSWHFKPSRYSYYNEPIHLTPLWYPDETDYPVPMTVMDAWTPGGQLFASVSDCIYIDGGAAFDDWYIRSINN